MPSLVQERAEPRNFGGSGTRGHVCGLHARLCDGALLARGPGDRRAGEVEDLAQDQFAVVEAVGLVGVGIAERLERVGAAVREAEAGRALEIAQDMLCGSEVHGARVS